MPPRRSTRSSVEPSSAPPPSTRSAPKRKRGSTVEPDAEAQEETKPGPSRSRKPPSTLGNGARRVSTRKTSQPLEVFDVEDSDDEDQPRPPKKTRPSLQSVQEEEESSDEIQELPKPKTRKAAAPAAKKAPPVKKTPASSSKAKDPEVFTISSDDDDEPPPSRPSRTSRTSTAKAPSTSTGSRTSIRKKAQPEPKEEEEEDDPLSLPARRTSAKPPSRSTRPTAKDKKAKTEEPEISVKSNPSRQPSAIPEADEEKEEEEPELAIPVPNGATIKPDDDDEPPSPPLKPTSKPVFEEEQSLLDTYVSAAPPKLSQRPPESEQPKPENGHRLVIHKLVLNNFKSYAGRQEIGPFHKSFSAIVGPNGSGKSNTIDALLFVFGWRASKMRQGKLSELIHNSADYPDLDYCSVEVHFREITDLPGPDAFEVVPNSSIVVTRTAYQDNKSKYTINKTQSTITEVRTLLLSKGIDLEHKRFLILQGEVESIALMKPKGTNEHDEGLLEYLEDIIGTSKYKEPIEEALGKMDALTEARQEKLNRLKITEREKNSLEKEKKEAEAYLRLQNEGVRAKSRLYQWYIWRADVNAQTYDNKIAVHTEELTKLEAENAADVDHLASMEAHMKTREATYETVKKSALAAANDLTAREKEEAGLEERKKYTMSQAKKLKKSVDDATKSKKDAERQIADSASKIKKERASVKSLETELNREEQVLEEITDSLKDKTQVFHDQIEAKQRELQPWTAKINTKERELNVAQGELDSLIKKTKEAELASQEAKEQLDKFQEDRQAKERDLQHTQTEREKAQRDFQSKQSQRKDLESRVQQLREKASSSRSRVDEARSSQMAATSQNRVLDSLTNLKQTGRIKGFHGRLGGLGTIPEKYDVAVSTACGSLNHMVVDTVDQGQACIEHLRKQNVGRASFMVLEKIGDLPGKAQIQTPENVPRLFDLITPKEPRFASVFYKSVSDTLVAKDLDQANRIAFGGQRRWRVVTLTGQLIDASGTMSGGGNQVSRGGMSSKLQSDAVSPETLRKYEQDSEQAARELEVVLQELRQLEGEVEHLSRSGPQLDVTLSKIKLEIQTSDRQLAEAQKRVKDLRAATQRSAADVSREKSLQKDIQQHTSALESLREKTAGIDADILALEQKILDVGGTRLLKQKSTVDSIRLRIKIANDEITKAEVVEAKATKDVAKHDEAIESNSGTLEELEADLSTIDDALLECQDYVSKLRIQVEKAQEAAENEKADLDDLKAQLDDKNTHIQDFRQKQLKLSTTLDELREESAKNDQLLRHWQSKHEALTLHEIDDDDEEEEADKAKDAEGGTDMPADGGGTGEEADVKPKIKTKTNDDDMVLYQYSEEELSKMKKDRLVSDDLLYDDKLKNLKPNMAVLKEYQKREEEFMHRVKDLDDTTAERDAQKIVYEDLRKKRLDEFTEGFNFISLKLKEMYQMITLGGNAELELVDSMDPFSEGIIFSVMPPKKSWKNISNLSGGEKTLSSLALVFALHHYKPTPLYFMDEIDAALDFRNVSIVANYIKDRTKNAQFIIISLRNDMFELSHRLIGIYKTSNTTKSVSINNHALQLQGKPHRPTQTATAA